MNYCLSTKKSLIILIIITTIICSILLYFELWYGCNPHQCEIYSYHNYDNKTKCHAIVYGKNDDHKDLACNIKCIDNIESYPLNVHLNITCYLRDYNYQTKIWLNYCKIVTDFIKIPLLPQICYDQISLLYIFFAVSTIVVWLVLFLVCIGYLYMY